MMYFHGDVGVTRDYDKAYYWARVSKDKYLLKDLKDSGYKPKHSLIKKAQSKVAEFTSRSQSSISSVNKD